MSTALLEPLHPSPDRAVAARMRARPRRRWEVWRSPDGQPPWARPLLLAIAAVAALLYAWNIADAGLAPFYSVAVKSMSESWKAFFYGAFDPRATITIDKLAGSFLPQALSARIFGFHPWSLALPQVIEGTIAVLVMYRVVRRWAGATPALLAAAIFALTPIAASMFGHSMEDGALTMCLVLAADAYQRAVLEGRLRSLLLAGVWVGLGFQAKMLQAWMVLPALILGYLLCAPPSWPRRLWHLAVFGAVTLAVSVSWMLLYTFTPAADRPYIDGSTDNSVWAMVFGYNGLERFGISVPGAVTSGPGVTTGGAGGGGAGVGAGPSASPAGPGSGSPGVSEGLRNFARFGGTRGNGHFGGGASSFGSGWTKLLGSTYGPEIGWLFPLALLALICGLLWTWRARRDDPVRGGFVMWGLWLATFFLVFSKMGTIPHTAYVASLAPALAALSGAGLVMFWRAYRAGERRGWMLPVAVAASLGWAAFLWRSYGGFLPWARDAILAVGAAAVIVMIAARLSNRIRLRIVTFGLAFGVVATLAAPAAWAASVLDAKYAGSSFNASAGPDGGEGFGGGGGFGGTGGFGGGGGIMGSTDTLTTAERQIDDYVSAHRDGASYLMAVTSWTDASPYILTTGQEVLPMGGFSGTVPSPTLARVQNLVRTGQLRFFLLDSASGAGGFGGRADGFGGRVGGFGGRVGGSSTVTAIESWVKSSCTTVPAKDYGGTSSTTTRTLYHCG